MGYVNRTDYSVASYRKDWKQKDLNVGAQSFASMTCLIAVEKYMREADDKEVAALVYENNDQAKKQIRVTQRFLKDHDFTKFLGSDVLSPNYAQYLPLTRIVESPLFSEKNESSILQVADAMAFAINRKLRNAEECDRFFEPINQQLIIRAKSFGALSSPQKE